MGWLAYVRIYFKYHRVKMCTLQHYFKSAKQRGRQIYKNWSFSSVGRAGAINSQAQNLW